MFQVLKNFLFCAMLSGLVEDNIYQELYRYVQQSLISYPWMIIVYCLDSLELRQEGWNLYKSGVQRSALRLAACIGVDFLPFSTLLRGFFIYGAGRASFS